MFDFCNYYANRFKVEVTYPLPTDEYYKETPLDREMVDNLFPVDAYGRLSDLITRILNTDSTLERTQLLGLLEDTSTPYGSQFAKLKDSDKLALLKPRNMQSLSELKRFGEYLEQYIDANNIKVDDVPKPNEKGSDTPDTPDTSSNNE